MFMEFDDCFVWGCDQCGLEAVFPPTNFYDRVVELKSRNWRLSPPEQYGDDWNHTCGRCRRKHTSLLNQTIRSVKG